MIISKKIKAVMMIIVLSVLCVITGALFYSKNKSGNTDEKEAKKAMEAKREEIENTAADKLVADARNTAELVATKDRIKSDLRQRIRDRLTAELQRLGSSGATQDCDT